MKERSTRPDTIELVVPVDVLEPQESYGRFISYPCLGEIHHFSGSIEGGNGKSLISKGKSISAHAASSVEYLAALPHVAKKPAIDWSKVEVGG